jgi:tripartite-type tricarboxylate transporter receptor subunit TctC
MITRRLILKGTAVLPLLHVRRAMAQQYPDRSVRIIVPAGTGTGIDAVTRFFTEALARQLRQPFVALNRPGAGGLLGYTELTRSAPDGYTLILTGIPLYLLPLFSEAGRPPYDPITDFVPIARVARVPQVVVVAADSPYRTVSDLLRAMATDPNDITYSSQGVGSTAHLCGVVFNSMSRTHARHIPYRETSMAQSDVIGGRITFTCQSSAGVLPLIQAGNLRALGVANTQRWDSLPDVPTVAEAGIPGFEVSSQLDFMAPAGTPEPILRLLSDEICRIAETDDFLQFCRRLAVTREILGFRELRPELSREAARWKGIADMARPAAG